MASGAVKKVLYRLGEGSLIEIVLGDVIGHSVDE
jgi:hypothetical protein